MTAGTFNVARAIWDHPVFAPSPFSEREAFLWLVSEAAWKPRTVRAGRVIVALERGQLCASLSFMATAWGWHKSSVDRYLKRLESHGMVAKNIETGQIVLTLCNYSEYQHERNAVETQAKHRRNDSETNYKKVISKEGKEEEPKGSLARAPKPDPILGILTEGWEGPRPLASPDAAASYIAYRKANKMPMTERAARMVAKELRALFDSGGDCDDALDMAQLKTWRGFKAEWYFNAKGSNHGNGNSKLSGSGPSGAGPTMGDALAWAARRKAAQRGGSAGSGGGLI